MSSAVSLMVASRYLVLRECSRVLGYKFKQLLRKAIARGSEGMRQLEGLAPLSRLHPQALNLMSN